MYIVTLYDHIEVIPKMVLADGANELDYILTTDVIEAADINGIMLDFDGSIARETLWSGDGFFFIGNGSLVQEDYPNNGYPYAIKFEADRTIIILKDGYGGIAFSAYVLADEEIHGANEDLKSGKVVQGINGIDSFSFTMLMSNPGFNKVHDFTTLVRVYDTERGRYEFHGRVLYSDTTMADTGLITKDVTCESNLGFLCDSQQSVVGAKNWTVKELFQHIIDKHNAQVEPYKRFKVGRVTVTDPNNNLYIGIQYANTWETLKEKLIDKLGGELWLRVENGINYLDYLASYGSTKTTEIRLSYNMKSIKQEKDPSAYITRLIPLGMKMGENDERLTIAEVNGGLDYIDDEAGIEQYGIHVGYHEWDDVTEASNLLTKAQAWLTENNRLKVKYSISALELMLLGLDQGRFRIGYSHRLYNSLLGIDGELVRVVKKTIDVCDEIKSTFEVGDNFLTASDIQISQAQEAKKIYSKITKTDEEIRIHVANEIEGVNSTISTTADAINLEIRGVEDEVSSIQLGLDAITSRVEDAEGNISTLEQTAESLRSEISGKIDGDEAQTLIDQSLEGITLSVSNGATSSTIKLLNDGVEIDSAKIQFTGVVTFNALSGSPGEGQTTIDGGWLKGEILEGNTIAGGVFTDPAQEYFMRMNADAEGGEYGLELYKPYTTGDQRLFAVLWDDYGRIELHGPYGAFLGIDNDETVNPSGSWDFSYADSVYFGGASADDLGITFDVPEPDLSDISIFSIGDEDAYVEISNDRVWVGNHMYPDSAGDYNCGNLNFPWAMVCGTEVYADGDSVTSDRNKKHDIFYDLSGYDALFDALRPVGYKLNNGTSGRVHIGMIAQDVEETVSRCGMTGQDFGAVVRHITEDGAEHYFLRYMEFIGLLIDQVQKLKARVARLEEA